LTDEAHAAIEELLANRGVQVPPRPKQPILPDEPRRGESKSGLVYLLTTPVGLIAGLIAVLFLVWLLFELTAFLVRNWIVGASLLVLLGSFTIVWWVMKPKRSDEYRARQRLSKQVGKHGFTELMFYAAEGEVERVRDLVNYGAHMDAQDSLGATALIYATTREQVAVVRLLLSLGANRSLTTVRWETALDCAERLGNRELVALLSGQP
jgi:hypothetical protein